MYGEREKGSGGGEKNTPRDGGDSFGAADGLLGYHSLIAAVVQGAEWLRK